MKAKEGEFDRFAPRNVAAVAAWLASDLCNGINGQVVKVMGGVVQLLEGGARSPRPPARSRGRSTPSTKLAPRCSASPTGTIRRSSFRHLRKR